MPAPKLKLVKRQHPIQRRLREINQTQKWLAGKLNVSEKTIGNWISGRVLLLSSDPRATQLRKILSVDKNYLHR